MRHVVDRAVELQISDPQGLFLLLAELVLFFQTSPDLLPGSDILVRGHRAAVGQRINCIGNDPAVGVSMHGRAGNDGVSSARPDILVGLRKRLESQIKSVLDQVTDRSAGLYLLG